MDNSVKSNGRRFYLIAGGLVSLGVSMLLAFLVFDVEFGPIGGYIQILSGDLFFILLVTIFSMIVLRIIIRKNSENLLLQFVCFILMLFATLLYIGYTLLYSQGDVMGSISTTSINPFFIAIMVAITFWLVESDANSLMRIIDSTYQK